MCDIERLSEDDCGQLCLSLMSKNCNRVIVDAMTEGS